MFTDRVNDREGPILWCTQLRGYLATIIFLVCVCVYIVIVALLMNVEYLGNRKAELAAYFSENNATTTWVLEVKRCIIRASASGISLKGFTLRYMEVYGLLEEACTLDLQSCATNLDQMMKDPTLSTKYNLTASFQVSSSNAISSIMLAPNGIVSNQVPAWPDFLSLDMFNATQISTQIALTAALARNTTDHETAGPFRFTFEHDAHYHAKFENKDERDVKEVTYYETSNWYALLLYPIFAAVNVSQKSAHNFWGFTNVLMNITEIIEETHLREVMRENKVDYILYNNDTADRIDIISSSMFTGPNEARQADIREFLHRCTEPVKVYSNVDIFLAVHANNTHLDAHPDTMSAIIFTSTGLLFLALIVSCITMLYSTRVYDGNLYAPKSTPFAILSIGPVHADDLWGMVPVPMAAVMDKFNKLFDRQLHNHHACRIVQMHPYTNSCVTRTVAAAIEMAMDLLTEMQRKPIDAALRELLSEEEGRLMMCCGIHWCTRASVSAAVNRGEGPRYDGEDVLFAARMWVHTLPNHVTISAAAEPYARAMARVRVQHSHDVFVRGEPMKQSLYTVTDASNKHLQSAAHTARLTLQREYDAYMQTAHEQQQQQQQQKQQQQKQEKSQLDHSVCSELPAACLATYHSNPSDPQDKECLGLYSADEKDGVSSGLHASISITSQQGGEEETDRGSSFLIRAAQSSQDNANVTSTHITKSSSQPVRADGTCAYSNSDDCKALCSAMTEDYTWQQVVDFYIKEHSRRLHLTHVPARVSHRKSQALHHGGSILDDSHTGDAMSREGAVGDRIVSIETRTSEFNGSDFTQGLSHDGVTERHNGSQHINTAASSSSPHSSFALMAEMDKIVHWLTHPTIPDVVKRNLQRAYEHQAIVLDVPFHTVDVMTYYFYVCFRLLLSPLATPERNNLYRRLRMAFGVPQQYILEHLAARCTIVYLQKQEQEQEQECGNKLLIESTDMI